MHFRESTLLRVIYHHPGTISDSGESGSQVRPYKILQAFRSLGIDVFEVTGSAHQRLSAIKNIKEEIKSGTHFDFVYSENRTIPFAMTEPHRLPLHPFLDHQFLDFCSKKGIPVSLFYRDAYWRDTSYRTMLPLWGRMITIPLYWIDWLYHTRYVDILYIPSMGMEKLLPRPRGKMRLKALPPGADFTPNEVIKNVGSTPGILRILYVGGVEPPTYDLTPLLRTVYLSPSTKLTLCCRETEWNKQRIHYEGLLSEQVEIVHASGAELAKLYATSDVHAIIRNPTDYLDFAVPVKVFEAVSYQTPIIVTPGTETARIVEHHGLGWVRTLEQMPQFLEDLSDNHNAIGIKGAHMRDEIFNLSWQARIRQIVRDLLEEDI